MHIFINNIPILAKDLWRERKQRHTYLRLELDNKYGEMIEATSLDPKRLYGKDNYVGTTALWNADIGQAKMDDIICQLGIFRIEFAPFGMGEVSNKIIRDIIHRIETGAITSESLSELIYFHCGRRFGESETKCLLNIKCPSRDMYDIYTKWYYTELEELSNGKTIHISI